LKQLINYYSIFSISIIIIGFILGYYSSLKFEREFIEISIDSFNKFSFNFVVFKEIFIRNLIVSLLLALGGYFTFGILTVLVLLWNGVNLGTMFTLMHHTNLNFYEFTSLFIIHGIFEFTAFIMFSNIGYKGLIFFKNTFKHKKMIIDLKSIYFIKPTLILLFAALVETFLISNF
jgi:uncharacterized membrane protein SpoIIM required for sporulation